MEPFEWLVLGIGLAVGGLIGANSKGVMRSAARGYLTVGEKTREWTGNMREDFQDAIEEARYEREESEYESDLEQDAHDTDRGVEHKTSAPARTRSRSASTPKSRGSSAKAPDDGKSHAGSESHSA